VLHMSRLPLLSLSRKLDPGTSSKRIEPKTSGQRRRCSAFKDSLVWAWLIYGALLVGVRECMSTRRFSSVQPYGFLYLSCVLYNSMLSLLNVMRVVNEVGVPSRTKKVTSTRPEARRTTSYQVDRQKRSLRVLEVQKRKGKGNSRPRETQRADGTSRRE
jgi:hypothetical protein